MFSSGVELSIFDVTMIGSFIMYMQVVPLSCLCVNAYYGAVPVLSISYCVVMSASLMLDGV